MAKVKFDFKDFLLRKGEVLVMGAAGFFLAVMLIWGVSKWGSANPTKEVAELNTKVNQVKSNIENGTPDPADLERVKAPDSIIRPYQFKPAPVSAFAQAKWPMRDPVAQPSTKRDNPTVLTIGAYQVDLTRSAMLGYDIYEGKDSPMIAVLTTKTKSEYDDSKLKQATAALAAARAKNKEAREKILARAKNQQGLVGNPMSPFPGGPMGGGFPGPGGAMGMMGGMGGKGGMSGPGMGFGSMGMMGPGGQFEQNAQRSEPAIKYVPLTEIDTAVKNNQPPALTVIPLRLVTVHAVVPYKRQLEEIKRALRLPKPSATAKKEEVEASDAEAKQWGPWYDGFEVQRRVTKLLPDGTVQVIQEFPEIKDPKDTSGNYLFEEKYIDVIDSRKIADHIDEGYIPYFLKPDLMLAMPLPQLAPDLKVKYPEIKLEDILNNIEKLKKANQKEVPQSEMLQQILKSRPTRAIYKGKTADEAGALGIGNPERLGPLAGNLKLSGGGMPPMSPIPAPGAGKPGAVGTPKLPEEYGSLSTVTVAAEVDNFLLRFVDCDVLPGYTYEYRIRLRMVNPNYGQTDLVANPEFARDSYKILYSKWLQLETPITVPAESFLYAQDVRAYADEVNKEYPPSGEGASAETKAINKLLQVKDEQAVVQVATWMEQVKAGDSTKREPVGGWVVAEMPVGRGEFVGRKQIVRLPLWSSETQQYVLRELSEKVVKGKHQPKGWMVDFSTQSVLVDFEGGKVKSKSSVHFDDKGNLVPGTRAVEEDAATELLIVQPDGKLAFRSSKIDEADPARKEIVTRWKEWVKEVEQHKSADGTGGDTNQFDPKKP